MKSLLDGHRAGKVVARIVICAIVAGGFTVGIGVTGEASLFCTTGTQTPFLSGNQIHSTGTTFCSSTANFVEVDEVLRNEGIDVAAMPGEKLNATSASATAVGGCVPKATYTSAASGEYGDPPAQADASTSSGSFSPTCPNIGPINPNQIIPPPPLPQH